jgi:chromosome segregation ATPase
VQAATEPRKADPSSNLNRAIELVQRSAMAMQSLEERLRKTESCAMECIHNAQQELAVANEKNVRSEATIAELQTRLKELETAISAADQLLAQEREDHQHAREWLNYLHDDIIKQLEPTSKSLEDLMTNPGPLLGMLEARAVRQLSSSTPTPGTTKPGAA